MLTTNDKWNVKLVGAESERWSHAYMRKWVEAGTDPIHVICNSNLVKYTRSFSSC